MDDDWWMKSDNLVIWELKWENTRFWNVAWFFLFVMYTHFKLDYELAPSFAPKSNSTWKIWHVCLIWMCTHEKDVPIGMMKCVSIYHTPCVVLPETRTLKAALCNGATVPAQSQKVMPLCFCPSINIYWYTCRMEYSATIQTHEGHCYMLVG